MDTDEASPQECICTAAGRAAWNGAHAAQELLKYRQCHNGSVYMHCAETSLLRSAHALQPAEPCAGRMSCSAKAVQAWIGLQLQCAHALQPAELCAEKCSCEGEGLGRAQAGEPTCFRITARDCFGNLRTAGGDDISVQVASTAGGNRASVSGSVADRGRGVYKVGRLVHGAGMSKVHLPGIRKEVADAATLILHAVEDA